MQRKIIKAESFNRHWMRFYYKQVRRDVTLWNKHVKKEKRVQMNKKFSEVRSKILSAIKTCDLEPTAEMDKIFLAAMGWVAYLEVEAMKSYKDEDKSTYDDSSMGKLKYSIRDFRNQNIAVNELESFLVDFKKRNPESVKVSDKILEEMTLKLRIIESEYNNLARNLNENKSVLKTKSKSFYEIINILNKNSSKTKIPDHIYTAAASIISTIYCLNEEPKSGWARYASSQYSNHKKRLKSQLK